ncbi:unnamed protein product [Diamesa serratosioi]
MDGIKSNFDKIFEEFSNNTSHSIVPKRLSFNFLNNTSTYESKSNASVSKKRKLSDNDAEVNGTVTLNKTDVNDSLNSSNCSLGISWESKLLRADLIEAQSRIAHLKKEIEHQNTIQASLELKYTGKEQTLEKEKNHYKHKASEFEKVLNKNRKKENAYKDEIVKTKNQVNLQKQTFDDAIFRLQSDNERFQQELRSEKNDSSNTIGQLRRKNESLLSHLTTTEEQLEVVRGINEDMKQKLVNHEALKGQLEQESHQLQSSLSRIKELEFEIGSFGDWKDLSKANHSRMNSLSELDKEVIRLRQTNKNLHDSLGNKLLLEEQVHDLEARLKKHEQSNDDAVMLRVQMESLDKELKDWKQLGNDYCQKNVANNPINVRSYIEQMLHRDLMLSNEKSSATNEKSSIQSQMQEMQNANLIQKEKDAIRKSLNQHQSILKKLQRKLLLVTGERDCQRQLLENYEKDLTITQGVQHNTSEVQQNRIRIEMLERTVNGYKDLCAQMEQELNEMRSQPDLLNGIDCNNVQYENYRKEMEILRQENEKLKRRKNELEIEIENLTLRQNVVDLDETYRFKVVHMDANPASIAYDQVANEIDKLKAEIERLRIRNKKLETGNDEMTTRLNETMNMTMNIKEINSMTEKYNTLDAKYKQMEKILSKVNLEMREVVYMLFGYKLDRYGVSNYKITSMYAHSDQDVLIFRLNNQGMLDMLESEYSKTLGDYVVTYLLGNSGSLAAFTAALTSDLINQRTVTSS